MEEKYEIMNLLQSKQTLTKELNDLIYGSVEIREKNSNKYIYMYITEKMEYYLQNMLENILIIYII